MDDIDRDSSVPVYMQLAAILREQIQSGEIPPDRAIASKRAARQRHGVSGETYDKAVAILRSEGLVHTVKGRGHFVSQRQRRHRSR